MFCRTRLPLSFLTSQRYRKQIIIRGSGVAIVMPLFPLLFPTTRYSQIPIPFRFRKATYLLGQLDRYS